MSFQLFPILSDGSFEGERSPILPDQRLQSALKPDIGRLAYLHLTRGMPLERIPKWIAKTVDHMTSMYPTLFTKVLPGGWNDISGQLYHDGLKHPPGPDHLHQLQRLLNIAYSINSTYQEAIILTRRTRPPVLWDIVMSLFSYRLEVECLKVMMMRTSRSREVRILTKIIGAYTFLVSRQLCFVHASDGCGLFLDYDAILCLNDVIEQRYLVSLAFNLYQDFMPTEYTVTEDDVIAVLTWGDNHLRAKFNQAFKVIKMYEPLCIAEMLRKSHKINISDDFIHQREEEYYNAGGLQYEKECLDKVLKSQGIPMLSELFGLFRIWGHPVVDEIAGCEKVKAIGKTEITPDPRILLKISACFTREFCLNYIKKEGRWPNLTFLNPENRIAKLYARRQTGWVHAKDEMDLQSWEEVILGKNFDYDYCSDYTQLIDDKSISTYRQHWDSVYNPTLLGYTPPQHPESRRVILEILSRDHISIEEIANIIMRREVPEHWKVIGLHSKERELKIEPRLFVMMVLEMRLYFCSTEYNLAEKILPYFPQQTMTYAEADLLTRVLQVTDKHDERGDSIPVVINIDFEKWNLRWRESTTVDIFKIIDNLFGTPGLYTYSHEFFRSSMFYLVSHYQVPTVNRETRLNPLEQSTIWYNDSSGKEGIRQKGWTLITIAALLYVESATGIQSVITGQGDNQVIVASFPVHQGFTKEQYIREKADCLKAGINQYMDILINTFERIGLPIKKEESWTSLGLFAYGKDIIWNGAIMPMSVKRCSRIMPDINDTFPMVANNLSNIFSAGQSTCAKGIDMFIPHLIATMEGALYLWRTSKYHVIPNGRPFSETACQLLRCDDNFTLFTMSVPHALGGYPVMTPVDYLARGHSDPVTSGLVSLRILSNRYPIIGKFLNMLSKSCPFKHTQDYKFLIADPTAINWDLPTPPTVAMKRIVSYEFANICKNRELLELFHADAFTEEQELIKELMTIRPVAPRVLNEIFRNSPSGAREGVLASVSHVRTIRMMAQRSHRENLFSRLARYEEKFMEHLVIWYRRSQQCEVWTPVCTTNLARKWRQSSWFPNENVAIEGVTMPHPLEQFILKRRYLNSPQESPAIIYIIEPSSGSSRITQMGQCKAFIGATTKERKMSRVLNQSTNDPPLKAALRLQTISDYVAAPNGNLTQLINNIMLQRTNVPLQLLRCTADRIIAGSRSHRLEDVTAKRGGFLNLRPNFTTHVYFSTDLMGRFAMGFENYNINYLLVLAIDLARLQYLELHHTTDRVVYTSELSCKECLELFSEEPLEMPSPPGIMKKTYEGCPLVYSKLEGNAIDRALTSGSTVLNIYTTMQASTASLESLSYMFALQVILRADRAIVGSVTGFSSQYSRYTSTLLGVGEIALIGFSRMVLAIAHLNMLMFLIKYYNRIIQTKDITTDEIIRAGTEASNLELYRELCQVYPIPEVRESVTSIVRDVVPPAMVGESQTSAMMVIQTIIDKLLISHIKNMATLPPLQCGTFPEWYLVVELNIIHRVVVTSMHSGEMNDEFMGRACVALKTVGQCEDITDGSALLDRIYGHLQDAVRQTTGWHESPHLLEVERQLEENGFHIKPMLRAEEGVEKWVGAAKERQRLTTDTPEPLPIPIEEVPAFPFEQIPRIRPYICEDVSYEGDSLLSIDVLADPPPVERASKRRTDHIFRLDGVSTASYKLLQIIRWLDIDTLAVACLGEGEGSMAAMCYKLANAGLIFYNSRLRASSFPLHRYVSYVPSELQDVPRHVLHRYDITLFGPNDITTMECVHSIRNNLEGGTWPLVTCDAEASKVSGQEGFKLVRGAALITEHLISPDGWMIFKTYTGNLMTFTQQLQLFRIMFAKVYVLCPHFSSHESTEVYICSHRINRNLIPAIQAILLQDRYPSCGLDHSRALAISSYIHETRTSQLRPLQFLKETSCRRILYIMRSYYNRPTWRNSLSVLVGNRYTGTRKDLSRWLIRQSKSLHSRLNVMLFSLFEQTHLGYDWERFVQVLFKNQDVGIQIYTYLRHIVHTEIILGAVYMNNAGVGLQNALKAIEYELGVTREHRLQNGALLCAFNVCKDINAWSKKYARHFYKLIGEIYTFSD